MVRTAATGIRVSAGKSSKKVSSKAPSTPGNSSSKSGGSSTKLPPIPYQETPSWQKPITTFFKSDGPLKEKENKTEENNDKLDQSIEESEAEAGPSKKKLKFDNDHTTESEKPEDTQDTNDKSVPETNKENESINIRELDEGASTSKE